MEKHAVFPWPRLHKHLPRFLARKFLILGQRAAVHYKILRNFR